jgi:hypothetical protein
MKTKKALKRLVQADILLSEVIDEFSTIDQAAHDLITSAKLSVARAREVLTRVQPPGVAEDEHPVTNGRSKPVGAKEKVSGAVAKAPRKKAKPAADKKV